MNRKTLIISLAVIGIIILAVIYTVATPQNTQPTKTVNNGTAAENANKPSPQPVSSPSTEPGKYISFSEDVIAANSGTKLLFFHAPWCPQCRDLEADIKQQQIPSGVTIIKVDYDSNRALRQKYGVTLQTTFVRVDDAGNAVKKFVAYDDPTLAAVVKNIL